MQRGITVPKGTVGWHHVEESCEYDKYKWVDDEQYPADDAKVVSTTHYHLWACLVTVDGKTVLAESFSTTKPK